MTATFKALRRHRNYRLFWFGQLISVTGTWLQSTGQAWLVLKMTGSALDLGLVAACQYVPILLFGLAGGVFADRFDKRRALIFTQSSNAVLALILAVLTSTGAVRLWEVFVLAACNGLVNTLDNPTRQSFVVDMVGAEDLPNAIALNSSIVNGARAVGPAIAGALIASVGLFACFYLNAFSYVAVIAGLMLMRPGELRRRAARAREALLPALAGGLRYVRNDRTALLVLILMAAIGTFGMNLQQVLVPVLASQGLKVGAVGFGVLMSAMGIGALIGALTVATLGRATLAMVLAGAAAFSVLEMAVALPVGYAGSVVLMFLLGGGSILYTASSNSLLQLTVPDELRGRVMSIYFLLFAGTTPIGAPLLGDVMTHMGPWSGFAVAGGLSLLGAVYAIAARGMARPAVLAPARSLGD